MRELPSDRRPFVTDLSREISRRRFLHTLAVAGGSTALASVLAACGAAGEATNTPTGGSAANTSAPAPTAAAGAPAMMTPAAAAVGSAVSASMAAPAAMAPAGMAGATAAPIPPTGTAAQIKRGGTLSWAYTLIPVKLDSVWSEARTDQLVLAQVIEGLVRNSRESAIEPAVADKWTISDDGLTYTFHIRPGIKFHNGNAVTPEDVIASFGRSKQYGSSKWMLAEATSFDKVDDSTLKITLKTKVASFLARLASNVNAIYPKTEIDKIGKDEFTQPIGTGPFVVKEWVRNDHLVLDKNPNYWQMGVDNKPLPYLDQLMFKQVAESATQVLQVQAGSVNGSEGIPFSQIPALEKDPRAQLLTFPQQQVHFMVLQLTHPPFDDVKVRQAMSLALDRKVLVDRVTAGKATAANTFFPQSALYWNATAQLPYDLAKAKQLIAQSKYPMGHTGAKLQLTSGSQLGRDNAVIAKDMWDAIGIRVTIEEVEGSTLSQGWSNDKFDAVSGYQWTNGILDPEQHVVFFCVDPKMHTGWAPPPRVNELVAAGTLELDKDKRSQIYGELQTIYNDEVGGTISLYYTPSVNYLSPDVKGFFRTPLGVPLFREVWLGK